MEPASQERRYHRGAESTTGYTSVPDAVMADDRLMQRDLVVYLVLRYFDRRGDWPSIALIGEVARCSKNSVRRAVRRLIELGYVQMRRELGFTNTYTVHEAPR